MIDEFLPPPGLFGPCMAAVVALIGAAFPVPFPRAVAPQGHNFASCMACIDSSPNSFGLLASSPASMIDAHSMGTSCVLPGPNFTRTGVGGGA
jgi:hypothetical protein